MTDCTKLQAWPKTINKQRKRIVYLITYLMPRLTINPNKHGQEDRWNSVGLTFMPGRRFPDVRAVPTKVITAFRRHNWINTQTPIPPLSFQRHFRHSSWTSFPSVMDNGGGLQLSQGKKNTPKHWDNTVLMASKWWGSHTLMYFNSVNTAEQIFPDFLLNTGGYRRVQSTDLKYWSANKRFRFIPASKVAMTDLCLLNYAIRETKPQARLYHLKGRDLGSKNNLQFNKKTKRNQKRENRRVEKE